MIAVLAGLAQRRRRHDVRGRIQPLPGRQLILQEAVVGAELVSGLPGRLPSPLSQAGQRPAQQRRQGGKASRRVRQLERDGSRLKALLRETVEQYDTSLEELKARRAEAQSGTIDIDETELNESLELPGADLSNLSGEELTVRVVPKQVDEFTCMSCFLVRHRSQLANEKKMICKECAG